MTRDHKPVFTAWQAPDTRDWHVVGKLTERDAQYVFNYTKGAIASPTFLSFSGMKDLSKTYISNDLFPLFRNRVLSPRRPEYPQFINWLGLTAEEALPVNILGRSGGRRETDNLQLFNRLVIQENGEFNYSFFAHGLSHLCNCSSERINHLVQGEKLYLCLDCQNEHHEQAVLIRTSDPKQFVGYCPRYIADDIAYMLKKKTCRVQITVKMLQEDAPQTYRLLCNVSGYCDDESKHNIMGNKEFETLS